MNAILLTLALLVGISSSSESLGRVSNLLYFQQDRFKKELDAQGQGIVLLNTQIGNNLYDRKQNIGIVLAEAPDYDLCKPDNLSQNKKQYLQHIYNLQMYLFIQISGKCAFGSQAQEAELQGAKGVILFDPEGSIIDSPYPRVNVDSVSIPVLILQSKTEGSKILQLLKQEDHEGSYALCKLSFASQKQEQFPKILYFYSSLNKKSLKFFKSLFAFIKEYDTEQQLSIKAIPIIYNSTEIFSICQSGNNCIETTQSAILKSDCFSSGKYCSLHRVNYYEAQDALDHELFSYELSLQNALEWSKYMKSFITDCVIEAEQQTSGDPLNVSQCGQSILKSYNQPLLNSVLTSIQLSWKSDNSFEIDKSTTENTSFEKIRKSILQYGVHQYPTLYLNDQFISDANLLLKDNLAKLLCKSFENPSDECKNFISYGTSQKDDDYDYSQNENDKGDDFNPSATGKVIKPKRKYGMSKAFVITFSVITGALIGVLVFYFTRRNHIKQMNTLLDKKVKQAVQKYKNFNSANVQFQELS